MNAPTRLTICQTMQRTTAGVALIILLSACSSLEEEKIDYKKTVQSPTLQIPPDLSQLRRDSRYAVDSNSATASGFKSSSKAPADAGTAVNSLADVRMERQDQQRWLVVTRPADKVWDALKEFWVSHGFSLTIDAPELGIMETEWAENRAKIPQDVIRRTLGKVLDSLYSSGERDKFRTRVERNAQNEVEIYITHRGMIENYADSKNETTIWQPRASDAELEIEFLRRLMIKLGAVPAAIKTAAAKAPAPQASTVVSTLDGQATIEIKDTLDRAWRRTGTALDRTGFTIEDRDRSKWLYFVRFVPPVTGDQETGFFGRLFRGKKEEVALQRYRIALTDHGGGSLVRVQDANGQAESSDNAERILKLLANELR